MSDNNIPVNQPVYGRGVAANVSIVGIDGEPPILDDTQVWREWALHDIYLGKEGRRKYVPKVNDFVRDINTLTRYKVISVDQTTLIPELEEVSSKTASDEMTRDEGRFFAGGTLATPCARQIFYDDSVVRPTLTVPAQFHIQGSMPHHAIAFKGTVAGAGGLPISVRYDSSFNVVGNEIPLEPIQQRDANNHTQWFLPPFYSAHKLEEGEMILILIYDDKGGLLSRTNFIVEKSALLRDVSDADKFVSAISLESAYIDAKDESNLLIPEQVLKNSINLMGKVHYTDGTTVTYPVDGNKFDLLYLDRASESTVGVRGVLVLKYYLGPNEKSVNVINNNNRYFITRSFNYTITERDGAYSVKLYPIPRWVNDTVGYQLDWYLFTLDRNQWLDVTNDVYITSNSPTRSLNGKLYGPNQQLNVAIDLGVLNNTFREHIHPQQVDIRLLRNAGDNTADRWLIGFEAYQNPPYGENLICNVRIMSGINYHYNFANNCSDIDEWFRKVYYSTLPQYRTNRENQAPKPNMFKLLVEGQEHEFPISMWNQDLSVPTRCTNTSTVSLVFFTRYNNNDVFYSMAPFPVVIS